MFVVLVNCVVSLTHWEELPILPGIWVDVLSANGTEPFGWMSFQPMGQRHLGGCHFSQWDRDIWVDVLSANGMETFATERGLVMYPES